MLIKNENDLYDNLDITAPKAGVQVEIKEDGKVLWVNVDGQCILRVCQIPYLEVVDSRKPGPKCEACGKQISEREIKAYRFESNLPEDTTESPAVCEDCCEKEVYSK